MNAMQCRMARAALNWSAKELSKKARVGVATVARFERGDASTIPSTLAAIQRALEEAGIEFIERGVRLRPEAGNDARR